MERVDIHKAKELIDHSHIKIVDIRDDESYREAHITDAQLINNSNLNQFLKDTDKNIPLLCYCYHGISSQSAAQYFKDRGFQTVYSMDGGFEAWKEEYPTT